MNGLGQQIKVQSLSDVKLEVIDTEPLQVYFTSNGVARTQRSDTGEIHITHIFTDDSIPAVNCDNIITSSSSEKGGTTRKSYQQFYRKEDSKLICLTCDTQYDSTHGMHYHLNNTVCGFGDKQKMASKKSYRDHYTRDTDNKFVCLGCSQKYETIRGVHYHLTNKKCGQLATENLEFKVTNMESLKQKPRMATKRNYLGLYRREGKVSICQGCNTRYHSIHGIHTHLNRTKCGFGDKFKSSPKTTYSHLYTKDEDKLLCNQCHMSYNSMHGMHYHLNSTKCGFGDKERLAQKRNYQDFYSKDGSIYSCNHCHFSIEYLQGIHRHLRNCSGFLDLTDADSSTESQNSSSEVSRASKVIKTIIYSENESQNYIGHDASI